MASKATPQDVKDLGFNLLMFNPTVLDETGFDELIQRKLDDNVPYIKEMVSSSVYDDVSNESDIKNIEKRLAAADLWEIRTGLVVADRIPQGLTGSAEIKMVTYCRDLAWEVITRLNGATGFTGVSMSAVITSHFPQDAS